MGAAPATQTTRQVRDQADGLADVTVHDGDVLVVRRTLASEADRERLVRALIDLFYNNITKENGP